MDMEQGNWVSLFILGVVLLVFDIGGNDTGIDTVYLQEHSIKDRDIVNKNLQ